MSLIIDPSEGKTVVIEFERDGMKHRSVRWSSDASLLDSLIEEGCIEEIKRRYAEKGAVVLGVSKIETSHVAVE